MDKFQEIINGEGLTLVDFFATWCGPCKMMSPILEEFKTKIGDKATVIKIDVDKNEELSLQYRIQSVPTLLLFKKGEVVWRHSGVISADHLVKLIGQHQ
ncbi:MAG: thioredoxin [Bacteroidales bacterium]